jgi:ribosomal-protein-alanine N-acetyltransferase
VRNVVKPVKVVPAQARYADDLARLHASLFDPAWDAAGFTEMLAHSGTFGFVARAGNPRKMVGFIVGRVAAGEGEILTLGVAQDWQRVGIGSLLVETLCRGAKAKGAYQLYLEVAASNSAARALYERFGFQERGRRVGYYARTGAPPEDAVNLYLTLFSPWWRPGGRP